VPVLKAPLSIMALTLFSSAYEYLEQSLQQATISILKQGPIPRHVGFVLDGNRRFARAHGATSTRFGHYEGFRQLEKVKIELENALPATTLYQHPVLLFRC
jgi:undecaprenyl pyrophosphate synthase